MADRDRRLRDPVGELPHDPAAEPAWLVYDGAPESMSDGVVPLPAPLPRHRRRWHWAVAGMAGAIAGIVAGAAVLTPAPPSGDPPLRRPAVIAPEYWAPVDASLTAGLVVVHGAAEADGIVLTSTGLVATSHARITGERRPRDGYELRISADGHDAVPATVVASDADTDIAIVQASGFRPDRVARPGTPVQVGDTVTLLDDRGGSLPVLGVAVTVTATDQICSRAGSPARPPGFRFSLDVASAEPGAALVRADGTVVGMYYGGDDATHHCAIPIAAVVEAIPIP